MGLNQIKDRIKGISSVVKVTKVVQLISANKFRKARDEAMSAYDFYSANSVNISEAIKLMEDLSSSEKEKLSPLVNKIQSILDDKAENSKEELILYINSDRSLCGNLNSAVAKKLSEYISSQILQDKDKKFKVYYIGKQSRKTIKNAIGANMSRIDMEEIPEMYDEKMTLTKFQKFIDIVIEILSNSSAKDLNVFYSRFASVMVQIPKRISLLQGIKESQKGQEGQKEKIIDADKSDIINISFQLYIDSFFSQILSQHIASEHALRMTSMDNATKNGLKIKENLKLKYNKLRQAKITSELIDIINGSNA